MERVYTAEEVREILKTSRHQIARWRREGKLAGIKIGGGRRKQHWRYTSDSVEALLHTSGNGGGR